MANQDIEVFRQFILPLLAGAETIATAASSKGQRVGTTALGQMDRLDRLARERQGAIERQATREQTGELLDLKKQKLQSELDTPKLDVVELARIAAMPEGPEKKAASQLLFASSDPQGFLKKASFPPRSIEEMVFGAVQKSKELEPTRKKEREESQQFRQGQQANQQAFQEEQREKQREWQEEQKRIAREEAERQKKENTLIKHQDNIAPLSDFFTVANSLTEQIDFEDPTQDLPGFGRTAIVPELILTEAGKNLRQDAQKLANMTLKLRSGAAVTTQEFERFKKEFGQGILKTDEQLRRGLKSAINSLKVKIRNLESGIRNKVGEEMWQKNRTSGMLTSEDLLFGQISAGGKAPTPQQTGSRFKIEVE